MAEYLLKLSYQFSSMLCWDNYMEIESFGDCFSHFVSKTMGVAALMWMTDIYYVLYSKMSQTFNQGRTLINKAAAVIDDNLFCLTYEMLRQLFFLEHLICH